MLIKMRSPVLETMNCNLEADTPCTWPDKNRLTAAVVRLPAHSWKEEK